MDPYEELANAIILQAVKDYRLAGTRNSRMPIEEFFLSSWFKVLTTISGEMLLEELRKEKRNER